MPFNISLQDAAETLGYSVRWLKNALIELVSLKLVEEVQRWWGQTYRLIIHNPGQQSGQKNGDRLQETSKKAGSNADAAVPYHSDLVEIEHGVPVRQEGIWYEGRKVVDPESEPNPNQTTKDALYAEVQRVAPDFNSKVFADAIARFGEHHIRGAIAAIEEQIERGNTRNPAAALYSAIFRGFTANEGKPGRRAVVKEPQQQPEAKSSGDGEEVILCETAKPNVKEPHFLPGTTAVFVAPVDERSRLQQQMEAAEREFQARVRGGAIASPAPVPVAPMNEDLSGLLVEIDLAKRELRLEREEVQRLLVERYGVRSQAMLEPEQLRDWLGYLQGYDGSGGERT